MTATEERKIEQLDVEQAIGWMKSNFTGVDKDGIEKRMRKYQVDGADLLAMRKDKLERLVGELNMFKVDTFFDTIHAAASRPDPAANAIDLAVQLTLREMELKRSRDVFKLTALKRQIDTRSRSYKDICNGDDVKTRDLHDLFDRFAICEKMYPRSLTDEVMACLDPKESQSTLRWADFCESDILMRALKLGKKMVGKGLVRKDSEFEHGNQSQSRATRAAQSREAYEAKYPVDEYWKEVADEDVEEHRVFGQDTHLHPNQYGDKPDFTFFKDDDGEIVMFVEVMGETASFPSHMHNLWRFLFDEILRNKRVRSHILGILVRGHTEYTVVCFSRSVTWTFFQTVPKPMYSKRTRRCFASVFLSILTASCHSLGFFNVDGWKLTESIGLGGESFVFSAMRDVKSDLYEDSKEYVIKFYKNQAAFENARAAYELLDDKLGYNLETIANHCFDFPYEMSLRGRYGVFDLYRSEASLADRALWLKLAREMTLMLHNKGYIHCDACTPNILFDEDYKRLRLSDVGSLRKYQGGRRLPQRTPACIQTTTNSSVTTHSRYIQPGKGPTDPSYDQVAILKSFWEKVFKNDSVSEQEALHTRVDDPLSIDEFCDRIDMIASISQEYKRKTSLSIMDEVRASTVAPKMKKKRARIPRASSPPRPWRRFGRMKRRPSARQDLSLSLSCRYVVHKNGDVQSASSISGSDSSSGDEYSPHSSEEYEMVDDKPRTKKKKMRSEKKSKPKPKKKTGARQQAWSVPKPKTQKNRRRGPEAMDVDDLSVSQCRRPKKRCLPRDNSDGMPMKKKRKLKHKQ